MYKLQGVTGSWDGEVFKAMRTGEQETWSG